jgi:hypothetical protein
VLNSIAAIGGGVWTREQGAALQKRLRAVVDQLRRYQLQRGRRAFQEWIRESLQKGAGALHRMTSNWGMPLQELSSEAQADGEVLTDPLEGISSKSQRWATLWQCTDEPSQANWWEDLRAAARQQEVEPIEEEHVMEGLKCFKRRSLWERMSSTPDGGDNCQRELGRAWRTSSTPWRASSPGLRRSS